VDLDVQGVRGRARQHQHQRSLLGHADQDRGGQENPLALIDLYKFYEVQKFVSITNHMWDGFWTLANGRVWAALPKDLQDIIERNLNAAAKQEREDVRALNASLQGALSQKGMGFNSTDPQLFRAALRNAGFYAEWKEKYGAQAWAVLESRSVRSAEVAGWQRSARFGRLDRFLPVDRNPAAILVAVEILVLLAGVISRYVLIPR